MTQAVRQHLLPLWRQEQVDQWIGGRFTHPTEAGTLQQNAKGVAIAQLCTELIELDFERLKGELEDEEYIRFETPRPSGVGEDV